MNCVSPHNLDLFNVLDYSGFFEKCKKIKSPQRTGFCRTAGRGAQNVTDRSVFLIFLNFFYAFPQWVYKIYLARYNPTPSPLFEKYTCTPIIIFQLLFPTSTYMDWGGGQRFGDITHKTEPLQSVSRFTRRKGSFTILTSLLESGSITFFPFKKITLYS